MKMVDIFSEGVYNSSYKSRTQYVHFVKMQSTETFLPLRRTGVYTAFISENTYERISGAVHSSILTYFS